MSQELREWARKLLLFLISGCTVFGSIQAFVASAHAELADALNTPGWVWTTNAVGWYGQPGVTHDGVEAAQSAASAPGQTSSMEIVVTNSGTVRFWWRCASSDSGDKLRFYINGSQDKSISGTKDWTLYTTSVSGSGAQRLRWDYVWASGSGSTNATGWVDQVGYGTTLPPMITTAPVSQIVLQGSSAQLSVAVNGSSLSYQWMFNGTNLLDGNGISGSKSSKLKLSAVSLGQSGPYAVAVTNGAGAVTSAPASLVVQRVISLAEALDAPGLAWKTSGSPAWFGQTNVTHDGEDAAQSGAAADGKSTSFTTNVTGPGTIRFWWKVSSETNNDVLLFQIAKTEQARISGEVDWVEAGPFAIPSGSQSITWTYKKSSSGKAGLDAGWVDQVVFIPPPPQITSQPASQSADPGATVAWKVGVSGQGLVYQWYWNGAPLSDGVGVAGSSGPQLTLAGVQTNQAGQYWVVVTNFSGAATSAVAVLTMRVPLYNTDANALPGTSEIATAMILANDYWLRNNPKQTNGWARGVYEAGNARAYQVLGVQRYYDAAVQWGEYFKWQPGWRGPTNADGEVCGQAYVDLYKIDPQPVRLAGIQAGMDNRVAYTKVDDWWWIDAFFMAGPVYARFGNLYHTNSYFDKMFAMYQDTKVRRGLYDAAEGLWYRDADAQGATTKNGQKQFWGRGEGWVIAACARVLEQNPLNPAHVAEFSSMLQRMASVLGPRQGSDGFWRASIYDPTEVPNPETSATALFTYAMAWGIRNGYLDEATYGPIVARAWNGMVKVALHSDGKLGYVQPQGKFPDSATYEDTSDHGMGAFLLAGSEVLLLAQSKSSPSPLPSPAPGSVGTDVMNALQLRIAYLGNAVVLRWNAQPGRSYQIWATDDLLNGVWEPVDSVAELEGLAVVNCGTKKTQFFRVEEKE